MNALRRHGLLSKFHIVLLCALLVFASFMTYTVGRYLSMAELTGEMGVAQFDVNVTSSSSVNISLNPSGGKTSQTYQFTVTSASEVAVSYSVKLTLPSHTASGVSIAVGSQTKTLQSGVTEYIFSNVGTIAAGGGTQDEMVTFTCQSASKDINLSGIKLEVIVDQLN